MNIFKVIPALFDVLRKGKMLSNAGAWKNVQAVLLVIAAIDDYAIIADFIVYAVSIYLVFATSDKVGFREKNITQPSQGGHAVPFDLVDPTHNRVRNGAGDVPSSDDNSTAVPTDYAGRDGWNG
jgi:hypothetical protein